jgi:ketosteroid isomerase-like protein
MTVDGTDVAAAAKDVVTEMFAAMGGGDLERMKRTIHPDVVVHEAESIPLYPGMYHGKTAFFDQVIGPMVANYDITLNDIEIIPSTSDNRAVGRIDATFTSRATNRSLRIRIVEIYDLTDGLISNIDVYYKDTAAMRETFPEAITSSI